MWSYKHFEKITLTLVWKLSCWEARVDAWRPVRSLLWEVVVVGPGRRHCGGRGWVGIRIFGKQDPGQYTRFQKHFLNEWVDWMWRVKGKKKFRWCYCSWYHNCLSRRDVHWAADDELWETRRGPGLGEGREACILFGENRFEVSMSHQAESCQEAAVKSSQCVWTK